MFGKFDFQNVEHRQVTFDPVILRLPVPPGVNNLYSTGSHGKRFVSKAYAAWRHEAGTLLNDQKPRRFTVPVEIIISIRNPSRRTDIDGKQKAVIDLLVSHHVIPDDNDQWVRKVTAQWADVANCVVEIVPF